MVCGVFHSYFNQKKRRVDEEEEAFGMGVTIMRRVKLYEGGE